MATERHQMRTAGETPRRGLRVLVADEDREALDRLSVALEGCGHAVIGEVVTIHEVADLIAQHDPDVSIVVVHDDLQHALQLISETVAFASGPVTLVVDDPEPAFVAEAAERGVHGLARKDATDIQSAIEIALRRHAEAEALAEKVDQLETALARRAMIERAKGVLMERHGLDELTAFERLRHEARNRSIQIVKLAAEVAGEPSSASPPR
jgi:AmiR/NasT family two-component response regulator